MKVHEIVQEGWPEHIQDVPPEIRTYFHIWDGLLCEEGIIFKEDQDAIPSLHRREIMRKLYQPHRGIEATLHWAGS